MNYKKVQYSTSVKLNRATLSTTRWYRWYCSSGTRLVVLHKCYMPLPYTHTVHNTQLWCGIIPTLL